jgi:hypothetical protein
MQLGHYNKAIAAFIMAVIGLVNVFFNTGIVVDPEAVNVVVGLLTPILVYLIPNKGA